MSAVVPQIATRSKPDKSEVLSRWRLDGVDNRTSAGRRRRDLCVSFADDLGGAHLLTTAQEALIKQLASVIVESERMQTDIVKGEKVDHEQLVRLSRLQATLLAQLGLRQGKPKVEAPPSLQDYLASRGAA